MDNPESNIERRSRKLDELKGKNIANYNVLLTTIIQSELDSIRSIIALSSAGIGVLFASAKLSEPAGTTTILTLLGLLGFGFAVYFAINFQLTASKKYEGALFGAEDQYKLPDDMRADIANARDDFKQFRSLAAWAFFFGLVSTIFLGIVGCIVRLP